MCFPFSVVKPKTPVVSVQKTENGNFNVTWGDQYDYRIDQYDSVTRSFLEDLRINLTYGIKGGLEIVRKIIHDK